MKEKEYLKTVLSEKVTNKEAIRAEAKERAKSIKSRGRYMYKKIIFSGALVLIIALIASIVVFTPQSLRYSEPEKINGYEEIYKVIEKFNKENSNFELSDIFSIQKKETDIAVAPPGAAQPETAVNGEASGRDYSETNIQTEGMDEGDIVKVDGNYIYKINSAGCVIIAANDGNLEKVSTISVENYIPKELFVIGDTLVMIGGIYEPVYYHNSINSITPEPMRDCYCYVSYDKTDIRIYDISSRANPELLRKITVDGNYFTSRIIEKSNELLYMVNYSFSYSAEDTYIPGISDSMVNGGEEKPIPAEDIYYYDDIAGISYLIVGKISLDNPEISQKSAFLGLGGEIYVSSKNIYVATYDRSSTYKTNVWGWKWSTGTDMERLTRIVKLSIDDLKQKASVRIPGMIKDRYSFDEYQGYLRVATTDNANNIFVLDSGLNIAGSIRNIAPGETIYSVRFNGAIGSLITFERIDPYYDLDLSDPENPKISKGLKEAGVSHYIHYLNDYYTIGVGKNSGINGGWVEWKELKVSLYEHSSGNPVNIKTVLLPEQSDNIICHSELFYNPKALLYNKERGLFAFTYEAWTYSYYSYSSYYQGLAVFSFDLEAEDAQDMLVYRGTLTNMQDAADVHQDDYYNSYMSFVSRGKQIGDYIYTISERVITSYDIETLEKVDELIILD